MKKDSFQKFKKALKNSQKIAVVSHFNPDGDAMGSSLALYAFLKKLGKKVEVIMPNAYPDFLHWLPGHKQVTLFQENEAAAIKKLSSADLIFTLDFNALSRAEKLGEKLKELNIPKIMIDHHQQPDAYAELYFHDATACSTCELVYDFIDGLGEKKLIDKKIAACLYTGLMTDTGSFRYPSVTSKTHAILAELLKTGISPSDIHSDVYDSYSLDRLKLLGFALNEKLKLVHGFPVAYFTLSEKELEKFNYQKGDTEGLVNYPFSIKGIKVCALFNETENYIKISFRSKGKVDVNKFARNYFQGGGHMNAAGGKSVLSLKETEQRFIELVKTLF